MRRVGKIGLVVGVVWGAVLFSACAGQRAFGFYESGRAAASAGNYSQALVEYDKAIAADPEDPLYPTVRGYLYVDLGKFDKAIADFTKVIELDPTFKGAYTTRGLARLAKKDNEGGVADCKTEVKLRPRNPVARMCLVVGYERLEQYELAIEHAEVAIALAPGNATAYAMRGRVYVSSRDLKNGCADFRKACELDDCTWYEAAKKKGVCF